jgi:O-antigen/teichoic acid export membrane protein
MVSFMIGESYIMAFKNDVVKVFSSNFINLAIGIITGFLVPAFLSLEDYGYLKTFTLYITYVGILHFGFNDGIYIKYGGKYEADIDKAKIKGEHRFLILFQLAVTLLSVGLGWVLDDMILIAFSLAILPINIQSLFKYFYQALGDFSIYSKIMILTPNLLLLSNLFIIFVLKISHYWPFIIGNIIAYYAVFVGLEIHFLRKYSGIKPVIDFKEIWSHFKIGIFIMVGNLSSLLFFAKDRWFVKFTLTLQDFALYSFAISMISIINIFINSVTMTFYPYLARGQDEQKLNLFKKYILIAGVLSCSGYFAFEFVIHTFLNKYVPSLDVILILFAGYPAMIIINALYINLYKANKQEKKYFGTVVIMLLVSVILTLIALFIHKSIFSIAAATTISFYIWYFYSAKDFPTLKIYKRELVYLGLYLITFYTSSMLFNWLLGFMIYLASILIISYLLYKKELVSLINSVIKRKVTIE